MTLQQFLEIAGSLSPAAIFALLWWVERAERREKEKAHAAEQKETNERCINALNTATNVVQGVKDILTLGGNSR